MACKQLCFSPRKVLNRRIESTVFKFVALGYCTILQNHLTVCNFFESLISHEKRRSILLKKDKDKLQSSPLIKLFPSLMATLRNKKKLEAISRETHESTRNSRGQNTLDPDLTQDYISQVSEEIEGRVFTKLSKKNLAEESHVSWVHCQNLRSFF